MDENGVKGKKKHTVEENPNCQTGVASAGRPGHNRGCSNLWENVLRSEDMSAAPIKKPSSPSHRLHSEVERRREEAPPEGKEKCVQAVKQHLPSWWILKYRPRTLFTSAEGPAGSFSCVYTGILDLEHTVSRTESD